MYFLFNFVQMDPCKLNTSGLYLNFNLYFLNIYTFLSCCWQLTFPYLPFKVLTHIECATLALFSGVMTHWTCLPTVPCRKTRRLATFSSRFAMSSWLSKHSSRYLEHRLWNGRANQTEDGRVFPTGHDG